MILRAAACGQTRRPLHVAEVIELVATGWLVRERPATEQTLVGVTRYGYFGIAVRPGDDPVVTGINRDEHPSPPLSVG